ncbi:BON domain-containing protein [Rhizobium sp. SL42]|uniref:BON domain-containing protein n=1 Tax=Rhizobium sp. SL42 TaxID=2806346 RepID=UPI001F3FBAC6|nr:BON domain-containing protein [Rhizobium sp. SL42]UJW73833.1 BON domain-containing protein [Rhizobium sp. SL42]
MAKDNRKTEFSREDDYRDYEQRDIDNGWPYADGSGATAEPVENHGYGETGANFDRDRNKGFGVSTVEANGLQPQPATPALSANDHSDDDDQLESDIDAALSDFDHNILAGIDIQVDGQAGGHLVTLRGAVDTAEERRSIELKVLALNGVRAVHNHITTLGIDSHIPGDAD